VKQIINVYSIWGTKKRLNPPGCTYIYIYIYVHHPVPKNISYKIKPLHPSYSLRAWICKAHVLVIATKTTKNGMIKSYTYIWFIENLRRLAIRKLEEEKTRV